MEQAAGKGRSVFTDVESAAPIEVFQLISQYNEDSYPQKVNLGVGGKNLPGLIE